MIQSKTIVRTAAMLLILAPLMAASSARAQAPSVGYLDPDPFIPSMPEYPAIQKELRELQASNQNALQAKADEFQAKLAEYQSQEAGLTVEDRAARQQELQKLQSELQAFAQEKERELGAKQSELMDPVLVKVQEAIDQVAAEKSLDMVLRLPALLYAKQGKVVNITLDVARKLGLPISSEASE